MNRTEVISFLVAYEIHGSRIAPYTSLPFFQNLLGKYYARKVTKKLKRMEESLAIRDELIREYGSILAAMEQNK